MDPKASFICQGLQAVTTCRCIPCSTVTVLSAALHACVFTCVCVSVHLPEPGSFADLKVLRLRTALEFYGNAGSRLELGFVLAFAIPPGKACPSICRICSHLRIQGGERTPSLQEVTLLWESNF